MKTKWRIIMIIMWLCLLCGLSIGLSYTYLRWKAGKHAQEIQKQIAQETIAGTREFYWISDHGALHLEDVGYGEVGIGYVYDRRNQKDLGILLVGGEPIASLDLWTSGSETHSQGLKVELGVGEEVIFGGYRIRVRYFYDDPEAHLISFRFGPGVILEVSLADDLQ